MKPITVNFNIIITVACLLHRLSRFLLTPKLDHIPLDSIADNNPYGAIVLATLSAIISTIIFMYAVQALWNRLFPKLCGWREITLAETYALGIFMLFILVR